MGAAVDKHEHDLYHASAYERIYAVVRQVPPGQVATYGQVAQIVGGVSAQMVGFALAALKNSPHDVPWQRIINAQGKVSIHGDGWGNALQRQLLEMEGIAFDAEGRVDFDQQGWEGPSDTWLAESGFYGPSAPSG